MYLYFTVVINEIIVFVYIVGVCIFSLIIMTNTIKTLGNLNIVVWFASLKSLKIPDHVTGFGFSKSVKWTYIFWAEKGAFDECDVNNLWLTQGILGML